MASTVNQRITKTSSTSSAHRRISTRLLVCVAIATLMLGATANAAAADDSLLRGVPGQGGLSWEMDLAIAANNGPFPADFRQVHVTVNPGAVVSRVDWHWSSMSFGEDYTNMHLSAMVGCPNFSDCATSIGDGGVDVSTAEPGGSFFVPNLIAANGNTLYHTLTFSGTLMPNGQNVADYGDTAVAHCNPAPDNGCAY
jgi:hypothetical protein